MAQSWSMACVGSPQRRWSPGQGEILVFEVEAYFDAFAGAADALLVRLMNDTTSSLPPTKYRLDQS